RLTSSRAGRNSRQSKPALASSASAAWAGVGLRQNIARSLTGIAPGGTDRLHETIFDGRAELAQGWRGGAGCLSLEMCPSLQEVCHAGCRAPSPQGPERLDRALDRSR